MSLYFGFLMVLNVAISLVHLLHLTPEFRMGLKGQPESPDKEECKLTAQQVESSASIRTSEMTSLHATLSSSFQRHPSRCRRPLTTATMRRTPQMLGPNQRSFLMTFYHQSHCIRELQKALVHQDHAAGTEHHVDHCLQYLRQTFLCEAVDSVEKGDFMKKNYLVDRVQDEMVCWDWEAVFHQLDESWGVFTEWRKHWN